MKKASTETVKEVSVHCENAGRNVTGGTRAEQGGCSWNEPFHEGRAGGLLMYCLWGVGESGESRMTLFSGPSN